MRVHRVHHVHLTMKHVRLKLAMTHVRVYLMMRHGPQAFAPRITDTSLGNNVSSVIGFSSKGPLMS